ncbi:response regulator [Kouleothrix sp.]|uniref:response regulator n=1 Tax=Kouleothrix sp. TaxID=2779161 RepID=UPI003919C058
MATRILVVDDEPAIGKLLLYQLAEFGYQASYLQNGLQALPRLMADKPNLVLLDVMMPGISGWEVCRQIRACSQVPVIMLTAKGADVDIVTGLNAGADDYLTKPFSMAQLHARIEAVLRRAAPAPALATALAGGAPAWPAPAESVLPQPGPPADRPIQPARSGQQVRAVRLECGLTLHQAERACNVRWEFLQAIEQENWTYIPRRELRRAITLYGEHLRLDLAPLYDQARMHPWQRRQLHYAVLVGLILVALIVVAYML